MKKLIIIFLLLTAVTALSFAQVVATTPGQTASVPEGFVRIEGGTFAMGSPSTEQRRDVDEFQHRVTVGSFYMDIYEVTQWEYQEIMESNPSSFSGIDLPVENVTWFDAIEYCIKRSLKEGLTPAYTISGRTPATGYPITGATVTWNHNANGYRLPTEAEWEYACRAGTRTVYNTGDRISNATGWYDANSNGRTHDVGLNPPNAWGLYDMHGNVWEWCWDWYDTNYYRSSPTTDPVGASSGSYRVRRGGSWFNSALSARSASRSYFSPTDRDYNVGFRLVRSIGQ